jgi:hypothetical protein
MFVYVVFGQDRAGIDSYVAPGTIPIAAIESLQTFAQYHFPEDVGYKLSESDFTPLDNVLSLRIYWPSVLKIIPTTDECE